MKNLMGEGFETSKYKRYLILANACIATFMATLDGSIVSIALPVISQHFSVNINTIQWVVTAYLLAISSVMLIWGKISDLYGKKWLFAIGISIFTIGSLLCAISGSFTMLIAARVVQAVGASIMMSLTLGIISEIFPVSERGKALGIVGTVVAVGSLVGPAVGGLIVELFGWRTIFFINLPFGISGVLLTIFIMHETYVPKIKKPFDIKGSGIFVPSIAVLFIGLLAFQDGQISSPLMAVMMVAGLAGLVSFVAYESKRENPLLDMRLFKNQVFSIGLATAYLSFVSMFAYVFFMPFYLQSVMNFSILKAGLLMGLYPITTGILAPVSGWLSDKITYKPLTFAGLLISAVGFLLIALLDSVSPVIQIALITVALGVGNAVFQSPNTSSVMCSVSRDKLGLAGSINAFFRNFGMVSGITMAVIIFMLVTKIDVTEISTGGFDKEIFMKGFRVVMAIAAGLSFFAALLSLIRNRANHIV